MKRMSYFLFVLGVMMLAYGLFLLPKSFAGVHVNIGVNLPVFRFAAPPEVVVIPGTYAYTVPDADVDIVFYRDYWYRPYGGRWYRSKGYNGPWGFVAVNRVPSVLLNLPPNYRHVHAGYERIPYGHFRKSWRGWERDRYWDRHDRHEERREERREARREHAQRDMRDHRDDRGRPHDGGGRFR